MSMYVHICICPDVGDSTRIAGATFFAQSWKSLWCSKGFFDAWVPSRGVAVSAFALDWGCMISSKRRVAIFETWLGQREESKLPKRVEPRRYTLTPNSAPETWNLQTLLALTKASGHWNKPRHAASSDQLTPQNEEPPSLAVVAFLGCSVQWHAFYFFRYLGSYCITIEPKK